MRFSLGTPRPLTTYTPVSDRATMHFEMLTRVARARRDLVHSGLAAKGALRAARYARGRRYAACTSTAAGQMHMPTHIMKAGVREAVRLTDTLLRYLPPLISKLTKGVTKRESD